MTWPRSLALIAVHLYRQPLQCEKKLADCLAVDPKEAEVEPPPNTDGLS